VLTEARCNIIRRITHDFDQMGATQQVSLHDAEKAKTSAAVYPRKRRSATEQGYKREIRALGERR
jgi:hypothetical protein